MHLHRLSPFLLTLPRLILADVEFTLPTPAATSTGGALITITWQDSGSAPALSDLTNYVLNLCAGGNTAGSFSCGLATLVAGGTFTTGNTATVNLPAGAGADAKNGYFLQMISAGPAGLQATNYSPRFTLSAMSGTFPPTILAGISSIGTSTDGPAASNSNSNENAGAGGAAGTAVGDSSGPYATPYNQQTGPTKYAPMAKRPGTKITAVSARMQNPTSFATLASAYMAAPKVQTTLTQSVTGSVVSRENAAAASTPANDMARFLERWKD